MKLDRRQWFRRSSPRRLQRFFRPVVEVLESRNAPNETLLSALLFAPPPNA